MFDFKSFNFKHHNTIVENHSKKPHGAQFSEPSIRNIGTDPARMIPTYIAPSGMQNKATKTFKCRHCTVAPCCTQISTPDLSMTVNDGKDSLT